MRVLGVRALGMDGELEEAAPAFIQDVFAFRGLAERGIALVVVCKLSLDGAPCVPPAAWDLILRYIWTIKLGRCS